MIPIAKARYDFLHETLIANGGSIISIIRSLFTTISIYKYYTLLFQLPTVIQTHEISKFLNNFIDKDIDR